MEGKRDQWAESSWILSCRGSVGFRLAAGKETGGWVGGATGQTGTLNFRTFSSSWSRFNLN